MSNSIEHEATLAASEAQAMRATGFSRSQLRYWDRVGLVHPATVRKLSERNVVRLYDFRGLLALLVIRELKGFNFSTFRIRHIVEYLGASYDYSHPLTQLRFAVVAGNEIVFQHLDGTWEGHRKASQIILEHTLHLQPLRAQLKDALARPHQETGKVEKRRKVLGSKPVMAGTRVPVDAVEAWLARGESTERILKAYPQLTKADVDAVRRNRASVA